MELEVWCQKLPKIFNTFSLDYLILRPNFPQKILLHHKKIILDKSYIIHICFYDIYDVYSKDKTDISIPYKYNNINTTHFSMLYVN